MNAYADKTQEKQSRSSESSVAKSETGGVSTFQFVDNRSDAIQMRKRQEMANYCRQAKQTTQLQVMADNYALQQQPIIQKKENNTGLPDKLKSGIENLSGYSMDDVNVHCNSDKPAQLQAHAFAQGTDIHIAPGQDRHLPHEAWHVVQQKQGRVSPTIQMNGNVNVNDDAGLEKEADVMGDKAMSLGQATQLAPVFDPTQAQSSLQAIQRVPWDDAVAPLTTYNSVGNSGATSQISVSGYNFTGSQYSMAEQDGESKVDVIANIAEQISLITNPPSNEFLSKSQLESTLNLRASIPLAGLVGTMPNAGHRNIYTGKIDPYIIRVPGKTEEGSQIALHYQFGKDSYGYIVKIEQEGKSYTMHEERGQEALVARQVPKLKKHRIDDPLMDRFASAHDTDDAEESIAEVASKSTTGDELRLYDKNRNQSQDDNIKKLSEKSKRLDAVAKIGGEGPRWDCVRELGRSGKLTNGSMFYCSDPDSYRRYIGITFQNLWGVWSTWFDMDFGIDDGTVEAKLIEKSRAGDDLIEEMSKKDLTDADYKLD